MSYAMVKLIKLARRFNNTLRIDELEPIARRFCNAYGITSTDDLGWDLVEKFSRLVSDYNNKNISVFDTLLINCYPQEITDKEIFEIVERD